MRFVIENSLPIRIADPVNIFILFDNYHELVTWRDILNLNEIIFEPW